MNYLQFPMTIRENAVYLPQNLMLASTGVVAADGTTVTVPPNGGTYMFRGYQRDGQGSVETLPAGLSVQVYRGYGLNRGYTIASGVTPLQWNNPASGDTHFTVFYINRSAAPVVISEIK